jgi:hypothetical protein
MTPEPHSTAWCTAVIFAPTLPADTGFTCPPVLRSSHLLMATRKTIFCEHKVPQLGIFEAYHLHRFLEHLIVDASDCTKAFESCGEPPHGFGILLHPHQ